ncbi:MAG: hypothetical protein CDV28_1648 [Candidatus Electronema aureum]|uniref:Uncharacterized protein n=1 Tax=Candidatus Electronema aureum TaxID=2005002 RepID=A0A521FYA6_9BACT|nr:MAG: hypothetical protein CDV28_1648 [Candidatus Electronema aureum]
MNCGRLSGQQTCWKGSVWQFVEVPLNSGLVQKNISAMDSLPIAFTKGATAVKKNTLTSSPVTSTAKKAAGHAALFMGLCLMLSLTACTGPRAALVEILAIPEILATRGFLETPATQVQLGPLVRKETKAIQEIPETLVIQVPPERRETPATPGILGLMVRKETKATLEIPETLVIQVPPEPQEGLEILATEAQVLL